MHFKEIKATEEAKNKGEPIVTLDGGYPCSAVFISLALARIAKISSGDVFRVFANSKTKEIKLVRVSKRCKPELSCTVTSNADGNISSDGFRRLKIPMRRHFMTMGVGFKTPTKMLADVRHGNKTIIFSYDERRKICPKKRLR